MICVNCKKSCLSSTICAGSAFTLNPCQPSSCGGHLSASYFMKLQYSIIKFYPLLQTLPIVTASESSISVTTSLSKPGILYCAASANPTQLLSSVWSIYFTGASYQSFSAHQNFTLNITNLQPSIFYAVYCVTSDFANHFMSLGEAQATRTLISTLCCKKVVIFENGTVILQNNALTTTIIPQFSIGLNSQPSSSIQLNTRLTRISCPGVIESSLNSDVTISPSSTSFGLNSNSLVSTFYISGSTAGCYVLYAYTSGSTDVYLSVNHSLVIYSSNTQPKSPGLLRAAFSSDLLHIAISFDSPTNKASKSANSTVIRSFSCNQLFAFNGAASISCSWSSSSTVIAFLGSSATVPSPGDAITLLSNKIQAQCIYGQKCTQYPYSISQFVQLAPPTTPLKPVVVLSSPTIMSSCDSLQLDPTSTYGSGGRNWNRIQWNVTATSLSSTITSQQLTGVASYLSVWLNKNAKSTNNYFSVPAIFFNDSISYSISLSVTNFIGQSSSATTTVKVSSRPSPIVRILGDTNSLYSWRSLSFLSLASMSKCATAMDWNSTMVYEWSLFEGFSYVDVQSISLDPRYFTLAPYTLNALASYTLRSSVFQYSNDGTLIATAADSISFVIKSSGIQAVINGSSSQVVSAYQQLSLSAINSYDIDNPQGSSKLSYQWSCVVYTPNYGASCGIPSSVQFNSVNISIPPNSLLPQKVYNFSVLVFNSHGARGLAFVLVQTQNFTSSPIVSIDSVAAKYDPGQAFVITGRIQLSQAGQVVWSSPSIAGFANSGIALAPLSLSFAEAVSTVFTLPIAANSLSPGLQYSFQLLAGYTSTVPHSFASATVLINMNRPPSGGYLSVSPTQGIALNTTFSMLTAKWQDENSDYPLTYLLAYYSLDATNNLVTVKAYDQVSYANTFISQGLQSLGFSVTCIAFARDVYLSTSNATFSVQVTQQKSLSHLSTALNAAITSAVFLQNPSAVYSAAGAALGTMNSVDCTVPVSCAQLNRQQCQLTTKTCGSCLTGYVGVVGDSNIACSKASSIAAVGASCSSNSACISGYCYKNQSISNGICANPSKACPNNCGGKGSCLFSDASGNILSSCTLSNPFCTAACKCQSGSYGSDCSLTLTQLNQLQSLRSDLCASINATTYFQTASPDVILSRANTIASIFIDPTQITSQTLISGAMILVSTIEENTDALCGGNVESSLMTALSNILRLGRSISPSLLSSIQTAMQTLILTCQGTLSTGQPPYFMVTDSMRVSSVVVSKESSSGSVCLPTLTASEQLLKVRGTSFCANISSLSAGSSEKLSIVQYASSSSSISVYSSATTSSRRLLSLASTPSVPAAATAVQSSRRAVSFSITIQNANAIEYSQIIPVNISLQCAKAQARSAYQLSGICPNGLPYNATCPPNMRGFLTVQCPGYVTLPKCTKWNGEQFSISDSCAVISYSPTNTTCRCFPSTGSGDATNTVTDKISTTSIVTYYHSIQHFEAYSAEYIPQQDSIIVSTMSCAVGLLICGFLFLWYFEVQQKSTKKFDKIYSAAPSGRTIQSFFDSIIPSEIRSENRLFVWLQHVAYDNPLFAVLLNWFGRNSEDSKTFEVVIKWAELTGRMVVAFHTVSFIFYFFDANDGFCQGITKRSKCAARSTSFEFLFFEQQHSCSWNASSASCEHSPLPFTFQIIITTLIIVAVASRILNALLDLLVNNLYLIDDWKRSETSVIPSDEAMERRDEFRSLQSYSSIIRQAAGLVLAQRVIDFVPPEQEAEDVFHLREFYREYGIPSQSQSSALSSVTNVRSASKIIIRELTKLSTSSEMEAMIMRRFIISNFQSIRCLLIEKYIVSIPQFKANRGVYRTRTDFLIGCFGLFLLVVYVAAMAYITIWFSFAIESRSTLLWLTIGLISLATEFFLLQPIAAWLKWVCVVSSFDSQVRAVCTTIVSRSRVMLRRTSGVVQSYKWLIQHLNPVCRAVRTPPMCTLPVSRLIMSLNDFDLPSSTSPSSSNFSLSDSALIIFFPFFAIVAILPNGLDDIFFGLCAIALLFGTVIGLYVLSVLVLAWYITLAAVFAVIIIVTTALYLTAGQSHEAESADEATKRRYKPSSFNKKEKKLTNFFLDEDDDEVAASSGDEDVAPRPVISLKKTSRNYKPITVAPRPNPQGTAVDPTYLLHASSSPSSSALAFYDPRAQAVPLGGEEKEASLFPTNTVASNTPPKRTLQSREKEDLLSQMTPESKRSDFSPERGPLQRVRTTPSPNYNEEVESIMTSVLSADRGTPSSVRRDLTSARAFDLPKTTYSLLNLLPEEGPYSEGLLENTIDISLSPRGAGSPSPNLKPRSRPVSKYGHGKRVQMPQPIAEFSATAATIYLDDPKQLGRTDTDDLLSQSQSLSHSQSQQLQQRARRQERDRVRSARSRVSLQRDRDKDKDKGGRDREAASDAGSVGTASQSQSSNKKDYRRYHGRQKSRSSRDGGSVGSSNKGTHLEAIVPDGFQANKKSASAPSPLVLRSGLSGSVDGVAAAGESSAPPSPSPSQTSGPGRIIQQLKGAKSPGPGGPSWSSNDILSGRNELSTFSILENNINNNNSIDGTDGVVGLETVAPDITAIEVAKSGPGAVLYEIEKKK